MTKNIMTMDFGTSNSLVGAVLEGVAYNALPLDPTALNPSVIKTLLFFPHANEVYYGQEAIDQYEAHSFEGRFIKSIKKFLPSESYVGSYIEDRVVRLETLIGYFLLEMKTRAEKHLQKDLEHIVLGRPAKYSHDPAKDKVALYRMQKAAELAGFKSIDFIPEPLAAAYDFRSQIQSAKLVLVVDLGGGTSDFTLVRMERDHFSSEDVLAMTGTPTAGDKYDGSIMAHKVAAHLGSEVNYKVPLGNSVLQMPKALLAHICSPGDLSQLQKRDFYQFVKDLKHWRITPEDQEKIHNLEVIVEDNLGFKVFDAIEQAKVQANSKGQARVQYEYVDLQLKEEMSFEELAAFSQTHTDRILVEMRECLNMASVKPAEVDFVYCTGGTSKLQFIQKELRELFSESKIKTGSVFKSVLDGINKYAQTL